jgi:hypothetical protein
LSDNPKDPHKADEAQFTDKELSNPGLAAKLANSNDMRRLAIRSLLKNLPIGVDDKLTTVKAAHHVDKDRFQRAFRMLMGKAKF